MITVDPFEGVKKPPRTNLERRRDAAQATLDKFSVTPFELGKGDCGRMTAHLLRGLGIKMPMAKVGTYKTPLSARAALKRAFGVETMQEWADKHFERIAPAMALPADLMEFRGVDSPIGAITVYLGNDLVLCYHEDHPEGAIAGRVVYDENDEPLAAWRTLPL